MVSGKDRSAIFRFVRNVLSRIPFARHVALPLDRAVWRLTGGRHTLTSLLTGLPIVRLTTTGARSGQPRDVILVGIRQGREIALIASNWGQAHHPAWLYNLRAHPQAMLAIGVDSPQPYVAREVKGAEREAWWQKAVDLYPGYARYEQRAAPRRIAVMVLSPTEVVSKSAEFG